MLKSPIFQCCFFSADKKVGKRSRTRTREQGHQDTQNWLQKNFFHQGAPGSTSHQADGQRPPPPSPLNEGKCHFWFSISFRTCDFCWSDSYLLPNTQLVRQADTEFNVLECCLLFVCTGGECFCSFCNLDYHHLTLLHTCTSVAVFSSVLFDSELCSYVLSKTVWCVWV